MAINYAGLRRQATQLIRLFGREVLFKTSQSEGPEHAPSYTETEYRLLAVDLFEVNRSNPGGLVEQTTRKLVIESLGSIAPKQHDKVFLDDRWHDMAIVRPLSPAGVVVVYEADLGD